MINKQEEIALYQGALVGFLLGIIFGVLLMIVQL